MKTNWKMLDVSNKQQLAAAVNKILGICEKKTNSMKFLQNKKNTKPKVHTNCFGSSLHASYLD